MRVFLIRLLLLIVLSLVGLIAYSLLASLSGLIPKIWWGGEADIPIGINIDILLLGSIPLCLIVSGLFKILRRKLSYKSISTIAVLTGFIVSPVEMIFVKSVKYIPGWGSLAPWHALFLGFSISCLIAIIVVTILVALISAATGEIATNVSKT